MAWAQEARMCCDANQTGVHKFFDCAQQQRAKKRLSAQNLGMPDLQFEENYQTATCISRLL
jgi:hypothetical protein